jgi:hypothetical protein
MKIGIILAVFSYKFLLGIRVPRQSISVITEGTVRYNGTEFYQFNVVFDEMHVH